MAEVISTGRCKERKGGILKGAVGALVKLGPELMMWLCAGLANSFYLTYHYYRVNVLHPPTRSFCAISKMIDCDRVASGFGSRLFGIPVATLGMFAHFFILFLILTECGLKLGIQTELHHLIYVILLMMVLFSIYEAFISFVILKAICLMCIALYITMALMLMACKQALGVSHGEILRVAVSLFFPSLSKSFLGNGLTAIATALILSGSMSFAIDFIFKTHFKRKAGQAAFDPR